MTRDEIKLVTFIVLALVIGAAVQHLRTRPPTAPVSEQRASASGPMSHATRQ